MGNTGLRWFVVREDDDGNVIEEKDEEPEQVVEKIVAKKVAPLSRKLGVAKLRSAFRLCIQTELMLRSTGVDRALALELLVIRLAAPMPRRKSA
ncbi:MAG: hypothetical protein HZB26_25735 [Candidatus Hydrogenedentes bacterium]|nr:hypothetical protein [Candidatus Hydrogenedentota bacterium]